MTSRENMRGRVRGEEGWVLVTSVVVCVIMLIIGLALLSVVDTQTGASSTQRQGDSAFNYAEGALNSTAFLLSRNWPEDVSLTPTGTSASCGNQTLSGTIGAADDSTFAGRIQNQLTDSFGSTGSNDYPAATTAWTVNICDDTGQTTTWNESLLTASTPAWDANGEQTLTGTDASSGAAYSYKVRRAWVRARAQVADRTRTVVGLVQVGVKPVLPSRYAALVGGFSSDLMTGVNSLLTGPTLTPVTTALLGQHKLYQGDPSVPGGGKLGIRCGLTSGCVLGGAFAALSATNLSSLLLANDFVQYGSTTAVSKATLDGFRREAKLRGIYRDAVASGGACIPASPSSSGKIVFIEQVGTGDQYCVINSSASAKMLVVANGRVQLNGGATSGSQTVFTGVIYAGFSQRDSSPTPSSDKVVVIKDYAKVIGAVYIDGAGRLDVRPPPFNVSALINTLPICSGLLALTCTLLKNTLNALGTDALLTQLISLVGLTAVVNGLTGQLSGYGPAVTENKALVDAITVYGNSGTIAGTFRQISPN
ncbi:MAG TPA: hypothetical protein VMY78_14745 [Solirubrobacteraceae bacterium]|nr:hypothetical protein [Solirubrobacteraceae bacterium]